jgi:hypothetical protein
MTAPDTRPPLRIDGWLRWVTLLLALILVGGALLTGIVLVFGVERTAAFLGVTVNITDATVWWGLSQLAYLLLGVTCIALLFGDWDIGPLVVPVTWAIVIIQLVDAARALLHLQVQFPITAVLLGLYAWKVDQAVKAQRNAGHNPTST